MLIQTTFRLLRTWLIFDSSLLTVFDNDWGSIPLDPAIMFDPGEGLVLLVGTIVDIVEEEDIGFECELPAGLAP